METKKQVYGVNLILSVAEEYMDGAIIKRHQIERIYNVNGSDETIGYRINTLARDYDDPDWKEKPFKSVSTTFVVKRLDTVEEMLADIVPDGTYPNPSIIQFEWRKMK